MTAVKDHQGMTRIVVSVGCQTLCIGCADSEYPEHCGVVTACTVNRSSCSSNTLMINLCVSCGICMSNMPNVLVAVFCVFVGIPDTYFDMSFDVVTSVATVL